METFVPGATVRMPKGASIHTVGDFPSDTTGVVTEVNMTAPQGEHIAIVKLTDHFESLDEWDNCIFVYRAADECSEITEETFEPYGFY